MELKMDLFGMMLNGAIPFLIGKGLDALIECAKCGDKQKTRIENASENYLGCKNCGHELKQYTNACKSTILKNLRVGHVAPKIHERTISPIKESGFFGEKTVGSKMLLPFDLRVRDYWSKQFTAQVSVGGLEKDTQFYSTNSRILKFDKLSGTWTDSRTIDISGMKIPDNYKSGDVMAIDLVIRSDRGDILSDERDLQYVV